MSVSILNNIAETDLEYFPYPHFVVRDALDPAYYAELDAAYPSLDDVAGKGRLKNNAAYYLGARETIDNPAIARSVAGVLPVSHVVAVHARRDRSVGTVDRGPASRAR